MKKKFLEKNGRPADGDSNRDGKKGETVTYKLGS